MNKTEIDGGSGSLVSRGIRRFSLLRILMQWEVILFIVFGIVIFVNSRISPYFLDTFNLFDTTFNFMERAIVALPMMFVIISGEIDISVASIIAFSSVFMGMAAEHGAGTSLIVFIGLGTGLFAGYLNGFIVTRFNIPSIAVTIGTMSLFRGVAYVILGDQAYTNYPASFAYFGQGYIGNTIIPFPLVLFIILSVVFGVALHRSNFGRYLYAIGNNQTASRFSGIPVKKYKLLFFCLNGLFSGLAAVILTSRIGSTRPNIANGWELEIITLVVLGGVSINGGKGTIYGVFISIFLLGFLKFGMALVNIPGKVMNIVTGFLLIIAIMLPGFLERMRSRSLTRRAAGGE